MRLLNRRAKLVDLLKYAHFTFFTGTLSVIGLLHATDAPRFAVLRIPSNLQGAGPAMGLPSLGSLTLYHWLLAAFLVLTALNAIGLHLQNRSSWRSFTSTLSLANALVAGTVFGFFALEILRRASLDPQEVKTAVVYSTGFAFILLVNLLTFSLLARRERIADDEVIHSL